MDLNHHLTSFLTILVQNSVKLVYLEKYLHSIDAGMLKRMKKKERKMINYDEEVGKIKQK